MISTSPTKVVTNAQTCSAFFEKSLMRSPANFLITHKILIAVLLFSAVASLLSGCTAQPKLTKPVDAPTKTEISKVRGPTEYRIAPLDALDVKFFYNPELNESVVVRPDGMISLQLIGDVEAAMLTPSKLSKNLREKYAKELKEPNITVIVKSFGGQQIFVGGEVNSPGLIKLVGGMTPLQAVINAGGAKETAKLGRIVLIRKGEANQPLPYELDLTKAIYGGNRDGSIRLEPEDVIYVPKSDIAKINQFVRQYIQNLLLIQGLSFSYDINNSSSD